MNWTDAQLCDTKTNLVLSNNTALINTQITDWIYITRKICFFAYLQTLLNDFLSGSTMNLKQVCFIWNYQTLANDCKITDLFPRNNIQIFGRSESTVISSNTSKAQRRRETHVRVHRLSRCPARLRVFTWPYQLRMINKY